MSELEEKLSSVLNNPQMMQQIMSLAQSMGTSQQEIPQGRSQESESSIPQLDPAMLRQIAGMASRNSVDQNQRALLRALGPYISRERAGKLEKAMRAARMASLASSLIQSGALTSITGR